MSFIIRIKMKTLHKFHTLLIAASVMVGSLGFTACSDDDDNFSGNRDGVVLTYFGTMPATRGGEITIHGENLNKVKAVVFPIKEEVTDFELVDSKNIKVTIPQEALAGHLRLVTASGDTVTSKSTLSYVEEITVSAVSPTDNLLPGDIITVTGDCVYNIASVTFAEGIEVPSTDFVSCTRRELKVAVPATARSGAISFSDGNEDDPWDYTYPTPLTIIIPTVGDINKSSYDFEETMVITGTNLQYVTTVTFPTGIELDSSEFEVTPDGTALSVDIPEDATSGEAVLTLASGVTITTPAYELPVISIDAISVDGASADLGTGFEDLEQGMTLRFEGRNLNRVKRLLLPGVSGKYTAYTLEGNNAITFTVPNGFQDGNITFYQNASVSCDVPAAMLVELPFIWKGLVELGSWGGNMMVYDWNPTLWKKFWLRQGAANTPGVMTFYFDHQADVDGDHLLKLTYGDWSTPWTNAAADESFNSDAGAVLIAPDATKYAIEVTQADIDKFAGGFVIYGCGLAIKSVKFEPGKTLGGGNDNPAPSNEPRQIWSGSVTLTWGTGGRVYLLGEDFEGAKPGDYLRFTFDAPEGQWCQAQINDGEWGNSLSFDVAMPEDLFDDSGNPITSFHFQQQFVPSDCFTWNLFHTFHEVNLILTQEHLDTFKAHRSDIIEENVYGACVIVQGDGGLTFTGAYIVPNN